MNVVVVYEKKEFKRNKFRLFEILQCLDECMYHTSMKNVLVEDIHGLDGDDAVIAFAFRDDRPVGFGYATINEKMNVRYVSCSERNKGHGTSLLRELEDHAVRRNVNVIELVSTVGSKPFYERYGYVFGTVDAFDLVVGKKSTW
jgi:GNAT superfamily N-acetyltransferase